MSISQKDRFLARCGKRSEAGCWLWSDIDDNRYGQFRGMAAHRVSYELFREEIPDGMFVCHHCDVPRCVNPDHLFLGTQKDNMQDKVSKGRHLVTEAAGPRIMIILPQEFRAMVDEWRRSQKDLPNFSEAVRRLIVLGIKAVEE